MTSVSRLLQDNNNFYSCGKNSWKSIKYSQSYDTVCQLALLGFKGLKAGFHRQTVTLTDKHSDRQLVMYMYL